MDAVVKSGNSSLIIKDGGAGKSFGIQAIKENGSVSLNHYKWTGCKGGEMLICEHEPDGIIDRWIDAQR